MGTTLLVDGNSLTYRAFFALPTDMATASGQVTNAVFGFTSMLAYVLKDQKPDGILVAFDRPEPTFRHKAEPEYKAQRDAAPDILRQQMGLVREVLDALGITSIDQVGWEADDLIATATRKLTDLGEDVIIVTGDRDSYQLVSDPHVRVLYNKRGVSDYALYDEAGIEEKTGVTPAMYVQYAALRGDTSDNLPGVPGVGEKTAAKLINKYGGLDGIFANVDEQTPKLKSNLIENEARARKNFDLMMLHFDAPLTVEIDGVEVDVDFTDRSAPTGLGSSPDPDEMKRLFEFLEFRALGGRITEALASLGGSVDLGPGEERQEIVAEVTILESPADAAALIAVAEHLDLSAAWTGEPGRSFLTGIAVVSDASSSEVAWLPADLLGDVAVGEALAAHTSVRGHNVKEMMRSLLQLDIEVRGLTLDTAIAAYLIDPAEARYALPDLIEKYTKFARPSDAAKSGQLDLDGSSMSDAEVAGRNALAVHHLAVPIHESLEAQGMAELYDTMENPLVLVLAKMEHFGVGVDIDELRSLNDRLKAEVAELAAQLRTVAGKEDLNLNSPKQLRELLYDEKGLTPIKKTKTGPSTDASTLEKLMPEWPEFLGPLMRHREVDKLRGTYGEGLLHEVGEDNRIHATFNQTVARTGRLSSDRPNLHNIPVRSEQGRQFRKIFVPSPGTELLVADYNQIELRCIAHLASDPGLIEAFTTGQDIHNATAARVFGVAPEDVKLDQRSKAKMVSYGLAYGMEAYGLAQRLNIPVDEAAPILEAYFEAFPNVKAYMDSTVEEARERGYTETLFGRRRPIPELMNANFRVRQAGERQAMNAGIQGLAADIFKVALVRIDEELVSNGHKSVLILQVHDEVLVEVPPQEKDTVGPLLIDIMRDAAELDVPLEVNVSWGDTWAAAKG
ncbi:MAG: DNA polymerase I [Acidimicrobiales bacterium]|jgi:DNA polymerase-1|uniref:DNA polymerase I n=1 Tax=uncultured Ilumatobacter sp. TaxID=879968 RepID=UPI00374FA157|tara:strand:- start:44 stop:2755 length:2712 start_codon:yes stop_codon:yes gene_type:complete